MNSQLEDKYRSPYEAWKSVPGPASNAQILTHVQPIIDGAIKTHVGQSNPLLVSRARRMALDGLRSYDPSVGRLETHLYNQLQGLKRVNRQQTQVMRVPERMQIDKAKLSAAAQDFLNENGREPTDAELADYTGFSLRRMAHVRRYNPAVAEGAVADPLTGQGYSGGVIDPHRATRSAWMQLVYDDLDPYHQKIMEYGLGLNGRKKLSNMAIAAKMGRSPGAISQAKLRIQKMLDEAEEISPFGG